MYEEKVLNQINYAFPTFQEPIPIVLYGIKSVMQAGTPKNQASAIVTKSKQSRAAAPVFLALILAGLAFTPSHGEPVLELFGLAGCHDCREFEERVYQSLLPALAGLGIQVELKAFDIMESSGYERLMAEANRLDWEYQGVPLLKAGDRFFYGNELADPELAIGIMEALTSSHAIGTETGLELGTPLDPREGNTLLPEIKLWLVIGAGLMDGVNPCALATLLFMVSALALGGRSGMLVASIGACFIVGVFLTYFLIGLGLIKLGALASSIPWLSAVIRLLTGIGLATLGFLSLRDWRAIRKGVTGEISLRLPDHTIRRIHRFIRKGAPLWLTGAGSIALGVLVSLSEFVCTGQIYLPTLSYISQRGMQNSLLLLFSYNMAFILPLAAVFLLVILGFSHERLTGLFRKHLAASKLAFALFFFLFAALMLAGLMPKAA